MSATVLPSPDTRMAELRGGRVSEATASAIGSLGKLGLYVDQKLAEANVEQELTTAQQAYVNEVNKGTAGPQSVLENTDYVTYGGLRMDVADNPQYVKELEEVRRRLSREKSALDQGARSTLAFEARVEDITRKAIAKRPGLRRELTAVAAGTLGFDPTGAQLRNLMKEASAEREASAFDKGRAEAQKARGNAYELAKMANPNGDEASWLAAADTYLSVERDRTNLDNVIQIFKNKSQLTEGERETYITAYGQKLDDALTAQMMLSDPMAYSTQEGWDGALMAVNKQLESALGNVRRDFAAHPDWQQNPLARAEMEKKLQTLEADKRNTIAKMSELWKSSIDAKTGSINAALAQERFNALMTIKKELRPYPNLYELVMLGNFSLTNAAMPNWMAGNEVLGKAINTLNKASLGATPPATPAGGGASTSPSDRAPSPAAQRADEERRAYNSGTKGTDEQNLYYYSGAMRTAAMLIGTTQSNEELERKSGAEISKVIAEGVRGIYVPGGGYALGDRTVQFANVEAMDDNPRAARPEEAVLDVATALVQNPGKIKYMDDNGRNQLATGLNTARTVYHNQLVRNVSGAGELIKAEIRKGQDGRPLLTFVPRNDTRGSIEQSKALIANNALASRWNRVMEAQWQLHPDSRDILAQDMVKVAGVWGAT